MNKVYVNFHQVYDLVFRARNNKLKAAAYTLTFSEWVKAGVAYNTRGIELYSRRISYFCYLYKLIMVAHGRMSDEDGYILNHDEGLELLRNHHSSLESALQMYYEDICNVYIDHLNAKKFASSLSNKKKEADFEYLVVLPSFDGVPLLQELFETKTFAWDTYEPEFPVELDNRLDSIEAHDTVLYRTMALSFDYGFKKKETGVLLEVTIWE